jgi:hypothetical protein
MDDTFFVSEFVPSVSHCLHSRKLEKKASLLFVHCPAHSSADVLKSEDGNIRDIFLLNNITVLI